jgi:hypothetical protein
VCSNPNYEELAMTKRKWNHAWLAPPLAALAALIAGCGDAGSSDTPTGPPAIVFSSLSITPTVALICLVVPGNTIVLNATPRDQSGQAMSSLGTPLFTSSDGAASVDPNGLVRAIGAGTAQITASLTAAGTTRTASASITVAKPIDGEASGTVKQNHPLPHIAVITASQLVAGNSLILNIQGQAFHSHTLALTNTQVRLIAGGCPVSQLSSEDAHSDGSGSHAHSVTFN